MLLKFKSSKHKNGFTLVELLVSIGLVLIIGTIGTSVIASILRSYNKAHIINEIEQNGNYVLSLMESQIRNASSVACDGSSPCLKVNVTSQEGTVFSFEIDEVTVGIYTYGVVKRNSEIITNDDTTSGVAVVISESHFAVDGNKVTIVLKIRQAPGAPGRVDYQADTTLQTTVVVRGGYE